jgi:hypothetical protein
MFAIAIHYPARNEIISYVFANGWSAFYEVCWAIKCGFKVSVIHTETYQKANW